MRLNDSLTFELDNVEVLQKRPAFPATSLENLTQCRPARQQVLRVATAEVMGTIQLSRGHA